jgi:hypothetical protein
MPSIRRLRRRLLGGRLHHQRNPRDGSKVLSMCGGAGTLHSWHVGLIVRGIRRIKKTCKQYCLEPRVGGCAMGFAPKVRFAVDSPLEGDGFELPVRKHRAMAPSHGFAAASHREAALRGAPASHGETAFRGAAGFREARRRDAVHPSRNAVLRRRAGRPLSGREARRCGPPIAKSDRAKT